MRGSRVTAGPAIRLRGVEWAPGGRGILGPIDLEVEPGECLVVVGPNGAGKTTLLRVAAGLLQPVAGEVFLDGQSLPSLARRAVARRIAYVPQVRPAHIPLTVEQMVLLGRYPHWQRRKIAPTVEDFAVVRQALERVGLETVAARRLDRLSGGEQQGVFIAACLAQEAGILVLDEPTTHLDPGHQQDVASLILDVSREAERTILCATHDLNFASLIADRIVGLRAGVVAASGAPADVLEPQCLHRLFEARFDVFVGGERPMTVLRLER
ncbi:MAG: ABC transporter ATP-binding protein [Acidobacteriota bacterium]|nr:ABC transporter ATP-binding protein [Acidobacteriota bacterium]